MLMAETGISESTGHQPGGHIWMGLHYRAEADKHERPRGKVSMHLDLFRTLKSIMNLPRADSCPSSSSLPIYQGSSHSAFSACLTCLQKLCRDGLVFPGKLRHWLHASQARGLFDSSPLHSLWVLLKFLCYRQLRDTQSLSCLAEREIFMARWKPQFTSINILISIFSNPETCLVFDSLLDWLQHLHASVTD